ncbi:MAG: glycoside hydrolase family 3 N-terminal domain-containing protein [Ignavibacteria bacterium]|nr:glycoside hydrolase family 3 N-terminal domain-containing protein [Ignavibacteria bacterium]
MIKNILFLFTSLLLILNTTTAQTQREKIAQMIMVGFPGKFLNDSVKVDLAERNLGGIIYFAANIDNPQQIKLLSDTIKMTASTPPFIAVDQEGGRVARLNFNNGFDSTLSAHKLGTIFNSENITRAEAAKMAEWLVQSGMNVNLAPVVDVNVNPTSPAIGNLGRSFSSNPDTVTFHASWFIDEFNKKGIVTTLKHYPGHGSALNDSHLGFTDITTTWSDSELIPYQQLISNGFTDFVMPGHLFNANLDSVYPATLSYKTVTNLLREQIGFNGLTITDELFMQAITNNYGFEESIVLAVNAGNDILLYRTNMKDGSSLASQVIDIIEQKVINGIIPQERINESYARIISLKTKYGLISDADEYAETQKPENFVLFQNHPNPFNPKTVISYQLPTFSNVVLKVYDILGNEVATLINEYKSPGKYEVQFDAAGLTSGIYFYRLSANQFSSIKKFVLLK